MFKLRAIELRWLARGLRLSIAISLLSAGWYAWQTLTAFSDDQNKWLAMKMVYQCAARQSDENLNIHKNVFGNINVKGVHCVDRDFWVSPEEILSFRKGSMEFTTARHPFDGQGTLIVAAIGGIVAVLSTFILMGVWLLIDWVWSGKRKIEPHPM